MLKDLLEDTIRNIISDLTQDMSQKGFNASGVTVTSFDAQTSETEGSLIGLRSFLTIVNERYDGGKGRKPGKAPPFQPIFEWIQAKGITPKDPKTTPEQLANAIRFAIGAKGTAIYRGEKQGVDMIGIIEQNMNLFDIRLGEVFADKIKDTLNKAFNEFNSKPKT